MPSTTTRQPYGTSGTLTIASRYSWSECGNYDDTSEPWIDCAACGASLSLPEDEDEVAEFDAEVALHDSAVCVTRAAEAAEQAALDAAAAHEAALLFDPEPF